MKTLLKINLILICLLTGIHPSGANLYAQEEPIYDFSAVLDEKTFNSMSEGAGAAWLGYANARAIWVSDNFDVAAINNNQYYYTFEEEFFAREKLAQVWEEVKALDPQARDWYLDNILKVYKTGFLEEYVWHHLNDEEWIEEPEGLEMEGFFAWSETNLSGHRPETHVAMEFQPR